MEVVHPPHPTPFPGAAQVSQDESGAIALSALNSGEAKVLGILMAGLKRDVERVEGLVKIGVDKLDMLARLEEQQRVTTQEMGRAFAEIGKVEAHTEAVDVRVTELEKHKAVLVDQRDTKRFGWVNVSTLVAAISALALVVVEYVNGHLR